MSKKLDLYLEKIIAKMNLDDAQREGVEREFRAHLDEAAREGVGKGLTEEQAETEAMLSFGQPSVIARQFGVIHGYKWFVFENVCIGIVYFLILMDRIPVKIYSLKLSLSLVAIFLHLYAVLRSKIEVNGDLYIKKGLFLAKKIIFKDIEKVSFAWGHLWGKRSIYIQYSNGGVTISPKLRNFRCAALALNVLCPDAAEPDVSKYLHQVHISYKQPGIRFYIAASLAWIIIFSFYLMGFGDFWRWEEISIFPLLAAFLVLLGLSFQADRLSNRLKRGLSWILFLFAFSYIGGYSVGPLFLREEYIRWILLGFPLLIFLAVLILFWRGKRSHLIFIFFLFLSAFFLSKGFIHPLWRGRREILFQTNSPSFESSWGDNDTIFSITHMEPLQLWIRKKEIVKTLPLEKGRWSLIKKNTSQEILLTYDPPRESELYMKPGSSSLYYYDSQKGLQRMENLPERLVWGYVTMLNLPFFSPDDRFLLTPLIRSGYELNSQSKIDLAFTHLSSGKLIEYNGAPISHISGWLDSQTYETFHLPVRKGNIGTTNTLIEVWRFHLETEEKELTGRFDIPGEIDLLEWSKGTHIPIQIPKRKLVTFINKDTGEIPDLKIEISVTDEFPIYSWNEKTGRLAVKSLKGEYEYLTIATPEKVIKEIPFFDSRLDMKNISFSPDGSRILAICQFHSWLDILGLVHYKIIDIPRNKITTIAHLSCIQSGPSLFQSIIGKPQHQWTPDSRSITYPVIELDFREKNFVCVHYLSHYEDWAERNL